MRDGITDLIFLENPLVFPAYIITSGYQVRAVRDYYNDCSIRRIMEMDAWQYTLSGGGVIRVEGQEYELRPGQAFFVHIPSDCAYYLPEGAPPWEFIYLNFAGAGAAAFAEGLRRKYGTVQTFGESSETLRTARRVQEFFREHPDCGIFQSSRLALEFLLTLNEDLEKRGAGNSVHALLRQIDSYIIDHLESVCGIGELARHCGYSRSHFSRLFHSLTGEPPHDYVMRFKLEFARRLLQSGPLSVKEIARRTGFTDPSYFCRAFRNRFHCSPGEFRPDAPRQDMTIEKKTIPGSSGKQRKQGRNKDEKASLQN